MTSPPRPWGEALWWCISHGGPMGNRVEGTGESPDLRATIDRRDILKMTGAALVALAGGPALVWPSTCFSRLLAATLGQNRGSTNASFNPPLLFPKPQEMKLGKNHFVVNVQSTLILTTGASASDLHLSRCLS